MSRRSGLLPFLLHHDSGGVAPFSALDLFANSEGGGWYDPSDLSTLWQDTAGTTPVTSDGDPVARIDDKSGNDNHLLNATATQRPLYKTSGGLHWLEYDGVDDLLVTSLAVALTDGSGHHSSVASGRYTSVASAALMFVADAGVGTRLSQMVSRNTTAPRSVAFNSAGTAFTDTAAAILADTDYVFSQLTASNAVESFLDGAGNGSTVITGTMRSGSVVLGMGGATLGGSPMVGRVYQAVHVARAWTVAEKADMEAFAAQKAGVTL